MAGRDDYPPPTLPRYHGRRLKAADPQNTQTAQKEIHPQITTMDTD
jgi:hypothetical protein